MPYYRYQHKQDINSIYPPLAFLKRNNRLLHNRRSLYVGQVFIQVNDLYGKKGIVLKFDVENGIGIGGKHRGSKPFNRREGLQ